MPCGLRAPRSHAALSALALFSLVPLVGCPEETPAGEAALILASQGGTQLEADGQKQLAIVVRAFDANQQPDNSAVTVTVERGTLATQSGSVDDTGLRATLTPQEGKAELTFQCPFREPGAVRILASNATTNAALSINCVDPLGSYVIRTDDGDCKDSTPLTASGASSCRVGVTVELRSATGSFPEQGVSVSARVQAATVDDPNDSPDPDVLSTEAGQLASASDNVVVVTDESGQAEFHVYSPRLALEQSVEIQLTATAPDTTQLTQLITVTALPFDNQSGVTLSPTDLNVSTGTTAALRITATDPNGFAPADATVRLSVDPASGASLEFAGGADAGLATGTELEVPITGGPAEVTFRAPQVTEERDIIVTAVYQPAPELDARTAISTITVYPEDALIVNASVDPGVIRSDENGWATITVTAARYQAQNENPAPDLDVRFEVRSSDVERITFGTRPEPVPATFTPTLTETAQTDASGVATIVVSSQNRRIRGRTAVDITVVDGTEEHHRTVEIDVQRDPVLQSLVFQSAEPAQIGVQESAYPSSSVVTFQVLDDLAQPISDVSVNFDINAASDPNASVVGQGLTDASGLVSTVLSAGSQAGPISVVATARYNGTTLVAESLPIGVFGGLPSFGNSYMTISRDEVIQRPPFIGNVAAVLADRFTNRAPDDLVVHFRAEAGNIDPLVTTADGTSVAQFSTGSPGAAPASLRSALGDSWSYGALVPTFAGDLTTSARFDPAPCFDMRSSTSCDLYSLCGDVGNDATHPNYVYCPLPRDAAGSGCWETLEAGVLTSDVADISADTVARLPAGTDLAAVLALLQTTEGALAYYSTAHAQHEAVRILVDSYVEHAHDCGARTSCVAAQPSGLFFIDGDECPVASGCMDFDVFTACPQDGLLSVTASTRGEEAFVDLNGNGRFDFEQEGSGVAFDQIVVDMPEPYLDKNDNGSFDEYFGSPRLPTYDEYRLTDLFGDEDNSGSFGYVGADGVTRHTNRQWDRDKQIFFATHFLAVGTGAVRLGQPCTEAQIGQNVTCTLGQNATSLCVEANTSPFVAGGRAGIAPGCAPKTTLQPNDAFSLVFQVVDANGNCASPSFAVSPDVVVEGPVAVVAQLPAALEESYCGFAPRNDSLRPWLEAQPFLGAGLLQLDVIPDCENADGPAPATIKVTAGDSAPAAISFAVNCPAQAP